ncbi:MAG TPA: Calx-beta domain-containing protein [Gammaproteobacteria bacterium]
MSSLQLRCLKIFGAGYAPYRCVSGIILLVIVIVLLPACKQETSQAQSGNAGSELPAVTEPVTLDSAGAVAAADAQAAAVEPLVIPLIAGQHMEVGTITVSNTDTSIIVVYETTGDWRITEIHLDVALDYSGLHTNRSGNPIPGQFDYSTCHPHPVSQVTYVIDDLEWSAGMPIYLATHAVVVSQQDNETAWAGDLDFPGKNWAVYFTYTTQEQSEDQRGQLQFAQAIYETAELGRGRPNLVHVEVQRAGGTQGTISAGYRITGGTASIDADYALESTTGVLEFLDGETSKVISIIIFDDNEYEQLESPYETIDLVLEDSCCLGPQQTTQVRIFDDEELN